MADPVWLHRSLSRVTAEELLTQQGKDGSFLVRTSESVKGAYVLCLLYQHRVHHYRIQNVNGKYCVPTVDGAEQIFCSSVTELINFYSTPGTGLMTSLSYPLSHETADDSSDDSDDEAKPSEYAVVSSSDVENESGLSASAFRNVSKFFEQSLKKCSSSRLDSSFMNELQQYAVEGAVQDVSASMAKITSPPRHFNDLVLSSGGDLFKNLQHYVTRLEVLNEFFDTCSGGSNTQSTVAPVASQPEITWDGLMQMLIQCRNLLSAAEKKATSLMKTVGAQYSDSPMRERRVAGQCAGLPPEMTFETRTDGTLKTKVMLKVNIEQGMLTMSRSERDSSTFDHSQVVQLIKSRSIKQKLGIKIDGKGRRDYIFSDYRSRELFCQLFQQMLRLHSNSQEVNEMNIFIGTFNMGDALPPPELESWFKSQGQGRPLDMTLTYIPHDLYVIGTQESAGISEKDWVGKLHSCLHTYCGTEFKHVTTVSLWGIRLVIMVKPEHYNKISHLQQSFVRTGVANTLGNKGGVGVSMHINGTSFCFICAHLTSGTEKCLRRNQNYRDIIRGLSLGQRGLDFDLTSMFHHVFWFGDLNYRLQSEDTEGAERIIDHIRRKEYSALHNMDQLNREKQEGNVFCSFEEEALDFPPTYRYARGTRSQYHYRKEKKMSVRINVPSYCDRVLWKSYPGTHIQSTSYGCTVDIMTSDHSPVFATFNVGIVNQYTPSRPPSNLSTTSQQTRIQFSYACAMINTTSKTTFYLEVHSGCLDGTGRSASNSSWLALELQNEFKKACSALQAHSKTIYTTYPEWPSHQMDKVSLIPILADVDYLHQQHLFIAIKSTDGDEVYGGGVVALEQFFSATPVQFTIEITRHGKATGYFRGRMHIPVAQHTRPACYDIVKIISTDELEDDSTNSRVRPRLSSSTPPSGISVDAVRTPQPAQRPGAEREPSAAPPPLTAKPRVTIDRHRIQSQRDMLQRTGKDSGGSTLRKPRSVSASPGVSTERPPLPIPSMPNQAPAKVLPSNLGNAPPPISARHSDSTLPPPPPARGSSGGTTRHSGAIRTQSAGNSPGLPSRPSRPVIDDVVSATSVAQLLQGLHLAQYTSQMMDNGWDDVHFLSAMSGSDLREIGITNPAHNRTILEAIKRLKFPE